MKEKEKAMPEKEAMPEKAMPEKEAKDTELEMRRKVYGVTGLMEYSIALATGRETKPYIHLAFTGGQITGYGVAPARFTTDDPYLQRLIEHSFEFVTGKIRLLQTLPIDPPGDENRS